MEFNRAGVWIPCSIVMECQVYYIIRYVHNGVPYQTRASHLLLRGF